MGDPTIEDILAELEDRRATNAHWSTEYAKKANWEASEFFYGKAEAFKEAIRLVKGLNRESFPAL